MAKLILHDPSLSSEQLLWERQQRFLQLSPQEKWAELMALIRVSIMMNGGHPLKQPQGKGIVIQRRSAAL
jgi:hypothetical protein